MCVREQALLKRISEDLFPSYVEHGGRCPGGERTANAKTRRSFLFSNPEQVQAWERSVAVATTEHTHNSGLAASTCPARPHALFFSFLNIWQSLLFLPKEREGVILMHIIFFNTSLCNTGLFSLHAPTLLGCPRLCTWPSFFLHCISLGSSSAFVYFYLITAIQRNSTLAHGSSWRIR